MAFGMGIHHWAWAGAAALGCALAPINCSTLIIYNSSTSVPTGFYVRADRPIVVGALVTLKAVDASPSYARARSFDGPRDRFIKRVAASAGAQICAAGDRVTVAETRTLTRFKRDARGRALPAWSGRRTLASDELFLVGDTPDSFDSRYWGPVRRSAIDGVWRPWR
jgi:conjugative transfer signal peptidase TraF